MAKTIDSHPYELLLVPQEAPNDETVFLVEWCVPEGQFVSKDQTLCKLESSKAVFELYAPRDGYLFHLSESKRDLAVGAPLAVLSDSAQRPATSVSLNEPALPAQPLLQGTATRKARELMQRHGLAPEDFPGLSIIREEDVLRRVKVAPALQEWEVPSAVAEVTLRQRRAIETVTASYQSIPHSYLSLIVNAAEASARVELLRTRTDAMISVSDLLVYGVSRAVSRHPKMNAFYDEGGIHLYEKTNVGVAMNLANGDLLVPVVANADSLPIDQIAGKLRGLQVKALRSKLTLTDLVGGTVTVTSLVGSGVSQVWPIIVPHQSAIFALGDPVPMGNTQSYFLCIAFDHRVLNGSEAAECLRDVVEVMLREDARG